MKKERLQKNPVKLKNVLSIALTVVVQLYKQNIFHLKPFNKGSGKHFLSAEHHAKAGLAAIFLLREKRGL